MAKLFSSSPWLRPTISYVTSVVFRGPRVPVYWLRLTKATSETSSPSALLHRKSPTERLGAN